MRNLEVSTTLDTCVLQIFVRLLYIVLDFVDVGFIKGASRMNMAKKLSKILIFDTSFPIYFPPWRSNLFPVFSIESSSLRGMCSIGV